MRANLERYGLAVKERFSADQPMGIGIWVAAEAAKKLRQPARLAELATWLAERQLVPFTFNGFPYGNFHQAVVKHRVYHPTWFDSQRLEYTLDLIEILDGLLPPQYRGTISTLPIAWGTPELTRQQWAESARSLEKVAQRLAKLEDDTGRRIMLCLEPEPGCALQRCDDVLSFFADFLCTKKQSQWQLRYLGVCHDVCHSAVMFEEQHDVLERFAAEGIQVGKVQVSSAIELDLAHLDADDVARRLGALGQFAEDRYLHQTTVRPSPDSPVHFFEDLGLALQQAQRDPQLRQGQWRVHFHVPIYLDSFNEIGTTQRDILHCLDATRGHADLQHFEVETYAWGVLPATLQRADLADGIADEMKWLAQAVS